MDPNATLRDIDSAIRAHDRFTALDLFTRYLKPWLERGGFQPDWKGHPEGFRFCRNHGFGLVIDNGVFKAA